MSFRATTLKPHHLALVFLGLVPGLAAAQAQNSPVVFSSQDAIVTSFIQATNTGGTAGGPSSPDQQWLKVEIHFSVAPVDPNVKYLDSVELRVWIEGLDLLAGQPGVGVAVGLTGSVTYVNLLRNKDVYGVFYVHPSTLGRYSSDQGTSDFDRKFNIHAEAYVDGKLMDAIDKKKDPDPTWYTKVTPVANLVYRQNQSPFLNADPDRYPAIKLTDTK